jgi:hypothetical protein
MAKLRLTALIAIPIALTIGFCEWSGFIPRGPGVNPYANAVAFSDMWWHVPVTCLFLTIALWSLWWLGERLSGEQDAFQQLPRSCDQSPQRDVHLA